MAAPCVATDAAVRANAGIKKPQESAVTVVLPTPAQLRAVAEQCGLSLTDDDVASFRGLMQGSIDAYNLVGAMPDEVPEVKYPRTPGYRPSPEENTRNAWYRKSTVKGAAAASSRARPSR